MMPLTFDQSNFAGARTLRGIFRRELDALALAQQLEHCPANRAPMEEVLDPSFVSNEPESLVDEQTRDGPGRHTRVLRSTIPLGSSQGPQAAETAQGALASEPAHVQ